MLQKGSFIAPSDTSGVYLVKVIQTRRCSTRLHAKYGKFLRVVLRLVKPKLARRRKQRVRAISIRSSHTTNRVDGSSFFFQKNALVLLKRRMNTMGKEVIGPSALEMKIKKFRNSILYIF